MMQIHSWRPFHISQDLPSFGSSAEAQLVTSWWRQGRPRGAREDCKVDHRQQRSLGKLYAPIWSKTGSAVPLTAQAEPSGLSPGHSGPGLQLASCPGCSVLCCGVGVPSVGSLGDPSPRPQVFFWEVMCALSLGCLHKASGEE